MNNREWIRGALLLGAVFFIAVLLVKPIGVSTQFSVAAGIVHSALDPDVIQTDETRESGYKSTNAYYDKSDGKLARSIKNPLNYDFIFVLAIPLGGLAGYLFDRQRKRKQAQAETEFTPPEINADMADGNMKLHLSKAIFPLSLEVPAPLRARMADSCTSGHMFSGIMQGSISGFIFAAAVFLAGIPTARYLGKYLAERKVD